MSVEGGEVLTIKEVASRVGRAETVIHAWTLTGFKGRVLASSRFGKAKMIRRPDLEEFLTYYNAVDDGRKSRSK